jgi:glycosyltransferase involved in cell wall biosynthesis
MGFSDVLTRVYSISSLPKQAPFRQQLALWKFRHLNLTGRYDFFIIAGDWAMSGAVNNHPNLWYVHSPLNELWAFTDFIKQEVLSFWKKPIYNLWVKVNRQLSLKYAKSVDSWVCNSQNTKKRIAKYYQQEASVIYPPVDAVSCQRGGSDNYWLSVNRLITHKRLEIQMAAFAKLPNEKLIVVASYEQGVTQFEAYKDYIESIKPANVEIKHWVNNSELEQLYAQCRGFITTAKHEDFGMTAVEAMAHGKPVIAPNEGGYPESVIHEVTGLLLSDINADKLVTAILKINDDLKNNSLFYQEACCARAQSFDVAEFIKKIRIVIAKGYV